MNIINQSITLFFPSQTQECEVIFDSALQDLTTQRIARIAKTIFYTISAIALTTALTLTEAGILSVPFAIPAIVTTIVAGLIFYRLNSLDSTYVEKLTDTVRESCVKKELERIFSQQDPLTEKEIEYSLKGVNRLLNHEIFNEPAISNILAINASRGQQSIGEAAVEQNKPIEIASDSKWTEYGKFHLPSYDFNVGVSWTGLLEDPIVVKYQSKEKVAEEELAPQPAPELDSIDELDKNEMSN